MYLLSNFILFLITFQLLFQQANNLIILMTIHLQLLYSIPYILHNLYHTSFKIYLYITNKLPIQLLHLITTQLSPSNETSTFQNLI